MATFSDQIRAFTQKAERKAAFVVRETVIGIGEKLVERSPVGRWDLWSEMGKALNPRPPYSPGEIKGSWAYSFGSASSAHPATIDPTGESSMRRIRGVMAQPVAGLHYLYNNAPYGMPLETGEHPSIPNWRLTPPNQSPFFADGGAHMTVLALMDANSIMQNAVARAK